MDRVKEEERKEFLMLSPLERMETMHDIFLQIVALKAKGEKVTEYEIYTRYLRDNPRYYERASRRTGRDKKLERFLSPPEDEIREVPEEYL